MHAHVLLEDLILTFCLQKNLSCCRHSLLSLVDFSDDGSLSLSLSKLSVKRSGRVAL